MAQEQNLQPNLLWALRIVWLAMLGSVAVYITISLWFAGDGAVEHLAEGQISMMELMMMAFGAGNAFAVFWVNNAAKDPQRARDLAGRLGKASGVKPGNEMTPEKMAAAYYFQVCVIRLALSEVAAVFGLVLSFVAGPSIAVAALYLLSAWLMIRFQPGREEFEDIRRLFAG